jgi:hypothetical protein
MDLNSLLRRRTDLSTFLVHLTKSSAGTSAEQNLKSIIKAGRIDAVSPMGHAVALLKSSGLPCDSQRCVSFTETPLEFAHLMVENIEGRGVKLEPYGLAFPKKLGRKTGVNPVWLYVVSFSGTRTAKN